MFHSFDSLTRRSGYEKRREGEGEKARSLAHFSSLCITSYTLFNGCVPCFFGVGQDRVRKLEEREQKVLFISHGLRLPLPKPFVASNGEPFGDCITKEFNWENRLERGKRVKECAGKRDKCLERNLGCVLKGVHGLKIFRKGDES